MQTYIALLRGINVSGQKLIRMADLKTLVEELGFGQVRTYIQSGNVLFEHASADPKVLARQIEEKLLGQYDFEVHVIVKTPAELEAILHSNPFLNGRSEDPSRLYVTLLAAVPAQQNSDKLKASDYAPEEFVLDGDTVYFYSPQGYGNAKMSNNFFESKLKVIATTRNWKTMNRLLELSEVV